MLHWLIFSRKKNLLVSTDFPLIIHLIISQTFQMVLQWWFIELTFGDELQATLKSSLNFGRATDVMFLYFLRSSTRYSQDAAAHEPLPLLFV